MIKSLRDKLYLKLESKLETNSSDQELKTILNNFIKKDYLEIPIIFDLISYERVNLLNYLYSKNMPFNYTSSSGANALHVACAISGSLEIVKFLYQKQIFTNVNVKTDTGETSFMLAVIYNHEDIVGYLLNNSIPDLNIKNIRGETVYTLAVKNKNILSMIESYNCKNNSIK